MIWWLLIPFLVALFGGVPIAFALLSGVAVLLLVMGSIPLDVLPQQMFTAVSSFPLMAIPFFILSGELMTRTGITERLIRFVQLLVGRFRGGLAQVNIISCMFVSGITGSGVADTAAIGSILIPAMQEEGYGKDYPAALTAAACVAGPVIPPSIVMVLYCSIMPVSIGALFVAGFLPGLLFAVVLMALAYYIGVRKGHPKSVQKVAARDYWIGLKDAALALIMPIVVLGGMVFGIATPTEVAAIAVAYALGVGLLVYRNITWRDLVESSVTTFATTAVIMLVVAASNPFGWMVTLQQVPQQLAAFALSTTSNPVAVMLMINAVLLVAGMFMETASLVLLLAPVLGPIAVKVGVDPLHFAIIMVVNLSIGLATPPVGVNLFVAAPIAKTSIERISKAIWPFLVAEVACLMVITFVPEISTAVPRWLGM